MTRKKKEGAGTQPEAGLSVRVGLGVFSVLLKSKDSVLDPEC